MPLVLCILDGWGVSLENQYNAIHQAHTPNYDALLNRYPHSLIAASGLDVGLPDNQIGNSEIGHLTIGSGRIIHHDLVRINKKLESIEQGKELNSFITDLSGKACHIVGLLSDGGVHSHIDHIDRIASYLESKDIKVYIHAFLDGRDTSPKSALNYVKNRKNIATLSGRYYGMDRDKNWDRTMEAYQVIIDPAKGAQIFKTPKEAIEYYYAQNITDEFIPPLVIEGYTGAQDGDALFIANFRPDRARQMTSELLGKTNFCERKVKFSKIMTMSQYFEEPIPTFVPNIEIRNTLSEIISNIGMHQLKIAESEKYAHVSYFFNGGKETPFPNEERILLDSLNVKTYDTAPQMRALEITEKLVEKIRSRKHDFMVVNYANADMVGHTGNIQATITAIETLDTCLGELHKITSSEGYEMIVTADHGNAESMYNHCTKLPHTAHTTNLVPFIVVSNRVKQIKNGRLSNIAGTVLKLLGIDKPSEIEEGLVEL